MFFYIPYYSYKKKHGFRIKYVRKCSAELGLNPEPPEPTKNELRTYSSSNQPL